MNKAMTVNNKAMTVNEIRNKFLRYMESHGHVVIPSSALTPENDPTTLFTGSGMQPMLPYLLGQPHPLGVRIADSQKCFRSQDIEEVGDNRHTTFFEMLGNWSLGDFFKVTQIDIMWGFLVNELDIDPKRLYFSVYRGNSDLNVPRDMIAIQKWQEKFSDVGLEAKVGAMPEVDGMGAGERIFAYPDKKNWWSRSGTPDKMPIGEPGGPDTEMFYDFDPANSSGVHERNIHQKSVYREDMCHPNCDCGRFVEIGNNVFMQYQKTESGVEELRQKNVDFGGGLERMAAAINNDPDVFNIDVFANAKHTLESISGQNYVSDIAVTFTDITNPTFAYRVILDHVRAAVFLIGDDVLPGNKDQMYFVRRLIRRAVRYARNLNINNNFMAQVAESFIDYYKDEYSNLLEKKDIIKSELDKEESKFRKTLESGFKKLDKVIVQSGIGINISQDYESLPGFIAPSTVFEMVTSDGFPIELIAEMANEKGYKVDLDEHNFRMEQHKELSRTASAGKFKGGLGGDGVMEVRYHTATHLLHEALRQVLGENVAQKGSNITSERLRFDFGFDRKITDEEKMRVENIVNEAIQQSLPVTREEISYDEARARGAIGLFGDKYGDVVSVYTVGKETGVRGQANLFSLEFCGGPHVQNTGELGKFKIVKEEAVSAGVRRIKAVLE